MAETEVALYWVMNPDSAESALLDFLKKNPEPSLTSVARDAFLANVKKVSVALEPLAEGGVAYDCVFRGPKQDLAALCHLVGRCQLEPLHFCVEVSSVGEISGLVDCLKALMFRHLGVAVENVETIQWSSFVDFYPFSSRGYYYHDQRLASKAIQLEKFIGLTTLLSAGPALATDPLVWYALGRPPLNNPRFSDLTQLGRAELGYLALVKVPVSDEVRIMANNAVKGLVHSGIFSFPLQAKSLAALSREIALMREISAAFDFHELIFTPDRSHVFLTAPKSIPAPAEWLRATMRALKQGKVPTLRVNWGKSIPWTISPSTFTEVARLRFAAALALEVLKRGRPELQTREALEALEVYADMSVRVPVFSTSDAQKFGEEITNFLTKDIRVEVFSSFQAAASASPRAFKLGKVWIAGRTSGTDVSFTEPLDLSHPPVGGQADKTGMTPWGLFWSGFRTAQRPSVVGTNDAVAPLETVFTSNIFDLNEALMAGLENVEELSEGEVSEEELSEEAELAKEEEFPGEAEEEFPGEAEEEFPGEAEEEFPGEAEGAEESSEAEKIRPANLEYQREKEIEKGDKLRNAVEASLELKSLGKGVTRSALASTADDLANMRHLQKDEDVKKDILRRAELDVAGIPSPPLTEQIENLASRTVAPDTPIFSPSIRRREV